MDVRFVFSPMRECLRGIDVLLHPARHAEQTPWLRDARRRLPRDLRREMDGFRFMFEPAVHVFPFVGGTRGSASFERELAWLRRNPGVYREAVLRRFYGKPLMDKQELAALRKRPWPLEVLPAQSLRGFCAMLEQFHALVFAPSWEPIQAQLRADIQMREKILARYDTSALLRTLVPDGTLYRKIQPRLGEIRRLTLMPSFFCWPGHETFLLKQPGGLQCEVAYPLLPLTMRTRKNPEERAIVLACSALGDAVRLRILQLLGARDLSTRELAGFLRLDEPAVSRHLAKLRQAGIVTRRRRGYFVMYALERGVLQRAGEALAALC